jgi:drug/metabolite transporter (DMT)-like permease
MLHKLKMPGVNVLALLTGSTVWGLIWYPYRVLGDAGIPAEWSSALTYGAALAVWFAVCGRHTRTLRLSPALALIGLFAGCANVGFTVAIVHGEVMRVVLLFYLAPVWTVVFAGLLLGERLRPVGLAVVALALSGAIVMLWQPAAGVPLPANAAEWLGLVAGVAFALSNVLARKASGHSAEEKSFWVLAGCAGIGLAAAYSAGISLQWPSPLSENGWMPLALVALIGVVLLFANLVVQYGLSHTPANRAIVIYLFELVVAACASWLLAGEVMALREWIGGAMIIGTSLVSARLEQR